MCGRAHRNARNEAESQEGYTGPGSMPGTILARRLDFNDGSWQP
jgi:hypothetical protein